MLLYRLNINVINYRKYSQVVAAVTTNTRQHSYADNKEKLSLAKSFYVGNFLKDVFTKNIKEAPNIPKCETLFGIGISKEYGGLALSSTSISEVYKTIGLTNMKDYIAHNNVVKCINTFGTIDQKKSYLPKLASGESVASFCMYENKYGYDFHNTKTEASFSQKDKKWVINGSKHWIINGKQADLFLVLAKTMDECNRPENNVDFFTAFLVKNSDNNGITIVNDGDYYNVTFNNTLADCMLGPENEGIMFYGLLLNADLLESSSATLGELKKIVENTFKIVKTHDRSSLIKLGKLNSHLYTMDCVLGFTSMILDSYNPQSDYELILARLFINKTTRSCLNLLNDLGISKKSHKYIENSLLFDGKSNLLTYIGALLGIQHAGQFMAQDVKQLRNPLMFPKYTINHIIKIQRSLKNKPKLNHYIEKYLHPSLKKQALDLEYCLSRLQFGVLNMFINLGPDTCYYQMILERANSIALDLYAMTAVLHRVSQKLSTSNGESYPTELIFANLFCNNIREQCNQKVNEIIEAPHNVIDPHLKSIGQMCFTEKDYFFEHPLTRNII